MGLARAWTRQLYRASGAAVLVPGVIACALAILAFAGGFSRLGAIGQALSGPANPIPSSATAEKSGAGPSAGLRRALAAAAAPVSPVSGIRVATRGGAGGTGAGGHYGSGHGRPGSKGAGGGFGSGGRGRGGRGGGGSHTGGSGTGTAPGRPIPPAPPTVVDKVVAPLTAVASKVPGPVGALATNTLQSVNATLDRILPLRLPNGPTAVTSTPTSFSTGVAAVLSTLLNK
jgi:hypothetical protein